MHAVNYWDLDKTNIKSEFVVTGDWFSPEEFTQELQVIPDRICKKGEKIHGDKTWDFNLWELFTEYEESWDINKQLGKILDIYYGVHKSRQRIPPEDSKRPE